jgi:predicted phage baseplate assembly protein
VSGLASPGRSARRAELLEQLIVALTRPAGAAGETAPSLTLRDRTLGDPTIALLDAWATVGDVLGFYNDRIVDEGYLPTARDPRSILALAALLGQGAGLGTAAATVLAYELQPDPNDAAVVLPAGLLCQSVPATGQQPQTFQTSRALTARPSWGSLAPKTSGPLILPGDGASALKSIAIQGTTANLQPNQAILLDVAGESDPDIVFVAGATVDVQANQTTVALTPGGAAAPVTTVVSGSGAAPDTTVVSDSGAASGTGAAPDTTSASGKAAAPSATTAPATPDGVQSAMDALVGPLSETAPVEIAALPRPDRTTATVFNATSDSTARILAALRPAVASNLYPALATSSIGESKVRSAAVLQVSAAPFGALAPPKQLLDSNGKAVGTADWPIGATQTVTFSMSAANADAAIIAATQALGLTRPEERSVSSGTLPPNPTLDLAYDDGTIVTAASLAITGGGPWGVSGMTFTPDVANQSVRFDCTLGSAPLDLTATLDSTGAVIITTSEGSFVWDPDVHRSLSVMLGHRRLTISWSAQGTADEALTIAIETPLPLADPDVLLLDRVYNGILKGTQVVIKRASAVGDQATTVVANVDNIDTVAASGFGMTGQVTQLKLDREWISATDLYQSALRQISVLAQPAPLQLSPLPVTSGVSGGSIDLSTLVAGMEAGRLIAITGTRTALPNGATVPAGELARVAQLQNQAGSQAAGDNPYTTMVLTAPLTYAYDPSTVKIYGNVVTAQQGATITDVLGTGDPSVTQQTFTLSSGPLLADPAPTGTGSATTLLVTVNGVPYTQVGRIDTSTPSRSYLVGADPSGKVTITFAAPIPPGSGNVRATYRVGDGRQGNVVAGQINQLLSRPSEVASVINPLPATGGAAAPSPEAVRAATPTGVQGLGRLVSVTDYANMARSWAGVAKATVQMAGTGTPGVLVTVAGPDVVPLDPSGAVVQGLAAAMAAANPDVAVQVVPAELYLIVLTATVRHDPAVAWDTVEPAVRAALIQTLSYNNRQLGQDVMLATLRAAGHTVLGVQAFEPTGLALVPASATPSQLASAIAALLVDRPPEVVSLASADTLWASASVAGSPGPIPVSGGPTSSTGGPTTASVGPMSDTTTTAGDPQPVATGGSRPNALAYITPAVPDTLLLKEALG